MLTQHLLLAFMWILYCILHSVLASGTVKKFAEKKIRKSFKYYRLFYTLFAFAGFVFIIYYQIIISSVHLFAVTPLLLIIGFSTMIAGLLIMLVSIKKYFMSLSGIKTLISEEPTPNALRIDGVHKYVRHPLYLGTFLFIWGLFILYPFLSLLLANIIISVYTLIGIVFEEQKLQKEFGTAYTNYQTQVPRIIPSFKRRS
jgi:protein-S-isoprenylcysteine O-methyltransferase Ste14